MTFSWQNAAAALVVTVAAVYIVMRLFRIGPWRTKPFCDCCDTCNIVGEDLLCDDHRHDAGEKVESEQHPPTHADEASLRRPDQQQDQTHQRS